MMRTTRTAIVLAQFFLAWAAFWLAADFAVLATSEIGAACDTDLDCASQRCFVTRGPSGGTCQCNPITHAGCSTSGGASICSDLPTFVDGLPECVDPSTLGQLGEECLFDEDCFTKHCYLVSETDEQGACHCNVETNAGCSDSEKCITIPYYDASPVCAAGLDADPKPIGSECWLDKQCLSGTCWYGFQVQGSPGSCQCDLETSQGCGEDAPLCWDDPMIADEPPQCIDPSKLADIGDECQLDSVCASLRCFFGEQLPDTPGTCQCNTMKNLGCPEGLICSDDPIAYDGLPECREPQPSGNGRIGAECENDTDCASLRCFASQVVGAPGSCQCNADTNAGCRKWEICSDDPIAYDGLPECRNATTTKAGQVGDECQVDSECESGTCWYGFLAPNSLGSCQCNANTNAGCRESEICSNDPVAYDGLPECRNATTKAGRIGEECQVDSDCASLRCFASQVVGAPGSCQCNSTTNAGCQESEICSDDPIAYDGLPECRNPTAEGGQIGDECQVDLECESGLCWYGFQEPGTPGSCQCDLETSQGCGDAATLCWDDPMIADEPPQCIDTSKLADIGDECTLDSECASLRCFYGEQLPDTPGTCQCNTMKNLGCPEGLICSDEPTYVDGLPECREQIQLGDGQIGAECEDDTACASLRCFASQVVGAPGSCQCNSNTGAGCRKWEVCSDDPIAYDGLPECRNATAKDGQIGDECQVDLECESGICFYGFISPGSPGSCQCNLETSQGCGEDAPLCYRMIADIPPQCIDTSKLADVGDECTADQDCASLRCFYGRQLPDTPGTCQCNAWKDLGCPEGLICSDEPTYVDGLPECREPQPSENGRIGAECEDDTDCASLRCFASQAVGTPGSCQCNSTTNAGCQESEICSDDPIAYDGLPECRNAAAKAGQVGDECQVDSDCDSLHCYYGRQVFGTNGTCACNSTSSAGCPEGLICSNDPTVADSVPVCRNSIGNVGDECQIDSDCDSLHCYYGRQVFGRNGTCACNSTSNAGCPEGLICSEEPTYVDGLPQCQPGLGQIGSECVVDTDCETQRCFTSQAAVGSCQCNSTTNAGCTDSQICSDDPIAADGLPECVGNEDTSTVTNLDTDTSRANRGLLGAADNMLTYCAILAFSLMSMIQAFQ